MLINILFISLYIDDYYFISLICNFYSFINRDEFLHLKVISITWYHEQFHMFSSSLIPFFFFHNLTFHDYKPALQILIHPNESSSLILLSPPFDSKNYHFQACSMHITKNKENCVYEIHPKANVAYHLKEKYQV